MKMKSMLCAALCAISLFTSCKKDKTQDPTPTPPSPSGVFAPSTGKLVQYLFDGNSRDTSGNHYNGGEASDLAYGTDRFNVANAALVLNGTTSHTEIPSPAVQFPFSYSLWINPAHPEYVSTIFQSDNNIGAYYGSWLQLSPGTQNKLAFNFGNGTSTSGSGRNSLLSSVALAANQWYHVVINVRGSGDMDMYINGVKDNAATYDGSASSIVYGSGNPYGLIGNAFGGQYFAGKMDDFRVYNRVLTPNEISGIYNYHP